ncbi:MAG: adenosylmethionine--8-amino-7-oxononanoate transaminase [Cytophagales bacterium]|uniref:adenosylmethionine--8-amino-7-oxononanoate transaminase n=1 Tax=Microcystis sp. M045S2 TaxID=2771167 RepID=UPI00258CF895|nr:adenosylmethionine--8-amino-7-oxononanoate transaminase [Microcystis sp. M045S2]MCA6379962.1 adenosylmethionine--8-amino-7-oxononanoate transaminase [Cytophagales bacterium]MCA2668816.1 adenosylmethionine--8-amino-7-oxononanoate transaminase [Microcystis sp. M045S2]MCA6386654.1 adenosylmethionine--8-amino-7-oxononanoate transaminase [Cytophagales bacterium]MCA6393328.1 adenosylmethionine--8-amino-7-oxononanoate transaminase [Cytophagales bacterium]MCA6394467.1 adenosylmethionine--8-amino-7-
MTLLEKDKNYIWHPFTPLEVEEDPIVIESAQGVYLYTADGKKIIDAVSSWWVNLHGHSNPVIAKAISEQARKLEHVIFAGFTHEPAITLAENLLSVLPKNQSKIFFSDDGSTAVEVGLKMAMQYWHNKGIQTKTKIIALEGAYHGDTFGAMSVGARDVFNQAFNRYLFNVDFIDFPNNQNEEKILSDFRKLVSREDVAAFIFEPLVQGAAGMRMYSPHILDQLISIANEYEVICIADEVFTGFGRTGRFFACDYLKNRPDIFALSKGITGGSLPLGATSCSSKVASAFQSSESSRTLYHGHSYTANPIACAAANASFKLLISVECKSAIETINKSLENFKANVSGFSVIKDVRVCGTILAIELMTNDTSSYYNPIRKKIYSHFLSKGILVRPLGNVMYIVPPYIISMEELQLIQSEIVQFISLISGKKSS